MSDALAVKRQKAKEIRDIVQPLMAHQKSLSAAQKEKATELLYMADQMDSDAQKMSQRLATLERPVQTAIAGAIRIASTLHPGVVIRFPNVRACVKDGMRGPLTLRQFVSGTQQSIVAIDDSRGTKTALPPAE